MREDCTRCALEYGAHPRRGESQWAPVEPAGEKSLLVPGDTCWRSAEADRFAAIIDGADYLRHLKDSLLRAQHRIVVVGWDLDYRTAFERGGEKTLDGPNHLGPPFLHWLLERRRGLNVFLLKSNLRLLPAFDGFWFGVTPPVSVLNQFTSARLHFAVDGVHPPPARCTIRRSWSSTM